MDKGNEYPTNFVLSEVANYLKEKHGDLCVTLADNHFTLEEALSAALNSVAGLPDKILLPTTNPARRQRLRELALENLRLEEAVSSRQVSRPIRTQGLLSEKDQPLSPSQQSQQQRSFVKKLAEDGSDMPPRS